MRSSEVLSGIPLSSNQQGVWFYWVQVPDVPVYNIPLTWDIEGQLDGSVLAWAWAQCVRRHAILRTWIGEQDGEPVAFVADDVSPLLQLQLIECAQDLEVQSVDGILRPSFRPDQAPLFRIGLVRRDTKHHTLCLSIHHIIADGWALGLLITDLFDAYTAISKGDLGPPDLEPMLAIETTITHPEEVAYWTNRLATYPTTLQLRSDFDRRGIPSFQGGELRRHLATTEYARLRDLAADCGCTVHTVVIALWGLVMQRFTGQDRVIIGTPASGRAEPGREAVVGFFTNMLPLGVRVDEALTVQEVLHHVGAQLRQDYDHENVPFAEIVRALRLPMDLSAHPLFQTAAVWQEQIFPRRVPAGLEMKQPHYFNGTSKWDLVWIVEARSEGADLRWQFAADRFEESTIERIVDYTIAMMAAWLKHPGRRVRDLGGPDNAAATALERYGASGRRLVPAPSTLVERVEAHAAAQPRACAIRWRGRSVAYHELGDAMGCVANALLHREQGGRAVGVAVPRSAEMAVAMLGALRGGSSYVPLDATLPPARLRWMIEQTGVGLVIGPSTARPEWVPESAEWVSAEALVREGTNSPRSRFPAIAPDSLACTIFTSGSTGTPKGTRVPHRSLLGFLDEYVDPERDRNWLHHSSMSWDALILELWAPIALGRQATLAEGLLTPEALRDLVSAEEITTVWITAAHLHTIIDSDIDAFGGLNTVLTGGDVLSIAHIRRLRARFPGLRIVNGYGPSECVVFGTAFVIPSSIDPDWQSLPIGSPVGDRLLRIIDARLELAPLGVIGEICITGDAVPLGYVNDPELTAERIVADPVHHDRRMYRTGDYGYWDANGQIRFCGRCDDQVKIRGYRVEPGEAAAALRELEGVQDAAVIVAGETPETKRLAAYVVALPGMSLDEVVILRELGKRVAAHLMPTTLRVLDRLPVTMHGKLDRSSLPPTPDQRSTAPALEFEPQVASAWRSALQVETIGKEDNFFALGGHSLSAMMLVAKLRQDGFGATVHDLFAAPRFGEFCARLTRISTESVSSLGGRSPRKPTTSPSSARRKSCEVSTGPLAERILSGDLPKIDAIALGYWQDDITTDCGVGVSTVCKDWCSSAPLLDSIWTTPWGRIGTILLPLMHAEIYNDQPALLRSVGEGLRLAGQVGARVVSLTGLLPSATGYGRDVLEAGACDLQLTTGHATTVAAIVLNCSQLLALAGRTLASEHLGVLGLGAIGQATLFTLLETQPHPRVITICDIYSKKDQLETIRDRLRNEWGFRGEVNIAIGDQRVPEEFYRSSFVVGATNVADVMSAEQLAPGTLVVDDSGPHCFDVSVALARSRQQKDVLCTEGGLLRSPVILEVLRYAPGRTAKERAALLRYEERPLDRLPGCMMSALIHVTDPATPATIGLVSAQQVVPHLQRVKDLGLTAAPPHLVSTDISVETVLAFRRKFASALLTRSSEGAPLEANGGSAARCEECRPLGHASHSPAIQAYRCSLI